MASLNERLGKLEARVSPPSGPYEMSPIMSSLLKDMDAQRREHDGRPPDPQNEIFTPEEEAANRQATIDFLPYLLGQREIALGNPATLEAIDRMLEMTREDIAELDREETP